jgi:hypothetical protein
VIVSACHQLLQYVRGEIVDRGVLRLLNVSRLKTRMRCTLFNMTYRDIIIAHLFRCTFYCCGDVRAANYRVYRRVFVFLLSCHLNRSIPVTVISPVSVSPSYPPSPCHRPIPVTVLTELGRAVDSELFRMILAYCNHVLRSLLPEKLKNPTYFITITCVLDFMIGFCLIALINL